MKSTSGYGGSHGDGTLSRGWEVLIAVLLGIAIALALWPAINELVLWLRQALIGLGMTVDGATVTLYWLGMAAIGAGFVVALNGPDALVNRLRADTGEWAAVLVEALTVACAVALWLTAAATWAYFEDEFNAYGSGTELPAVGLAVLLIIGAVALRWLRRRRPIDG